jgi:hypothetical protein
VIHHHYQESAIEEFQKLKVERKRKESEESFRRLELEALAQSQPQLQEKKDHDLNSTVQNLLDSYNSETIVALRMKNSVRIQPQLTAEYFRQEKELSELTLGGLYEITIGYGMNGVDAIDVSDFQKYRAQQLLDAVMAHLQSL